MAITVIDSQTGNYIVLFYRRGIPIVYEMTPYGFFVRRLRYVYVYVGYSVAVPSKDKPLFLDIIAQKRIRAEELEELYSIQHELHDTVIDYTLDYYGDQIRNYLEEGTRFWHTDIVAYGVGVTAEQKIPEGTDVMLIYQGRAEEIAPSLKYVIHLRWETW